MVSVVNVCAVNQRFVTKPEDCYIPCFFKKKFCRKFRALNVMDRRGATNNPLVIDRYIYGISSISGSADPAKAWWELVVVIILSTMTEK
jgi:hypothetical protein